MGFRLSRPTGSREIPESISCVPQIEFEKVHLITYLLDLCVGVEPQAESLRPAAPRLTVFAVDARYPFPEQEITEEMAREAVQLARQVREFVLERLPKDARK